MKIGEHDFQERKKGNIAGIKLLVTSEIFMYFGTGTKNKNVF